MRAEAPAARGCPQLVGADAVHLDGDGDADVLSASETIPLDVPYYSSIDWYENLGAGSFTRHTLHFDYDDTMSDVVAADLDGDGDADVIQGALEPQGSVAWYENLGGGSFGAKQGIGTVADNVYQVVVVDLNGDGDADVLSASNYDDRIAWYENLGAGAFDTHDITTAADRAESVFATDLDLDGDPDVLFASSGDDKVAWYENLGGGSFGPQQVINSPPYFYVQVEFVYAADLDGDGDADVLSSARDSSGQDSRIDWYENLTLSPTADTGDTGARVVETADTGSAEPLDTGTVDSGTPTAGTTDAADVMGTAPPGCGCTARPKGSGMVLELLGRRRQGRSR
jgi:hypothetical protein